MTKNEIATRIITTLRQNYKDRWLSKRFVLHILEEKMRFLLSQKLRDRSLFREENLMSQINCYEFKKVDKLKCDIIEFRTCNHVMKGTKKLPELLYSRYGSSIRMITNLDQSEEIKPTNPKDYIRDRKRKYYNYPPGYYVRDGYPYIVNSDIEAGFIELITLDTKRVAEIDCESEVGSCKAATDYDFISSDKLAEIAVQQTIQEIAQTYIQIQPDEKPDNNENSI